MIVIVTQPFPPSPGGIQNLLAGTARHIAKAGYDVTVLADGGSEAKAWDKRSTNPHQTYRFTGPRQIRRPLKAWKLHRLLRKGAIEAIYADSWKSLEIVPAGLNIPIVTWAHGNELSQPEKKGARIKDAFSKASHILFVSNDTLDRARPFLSAEANFSVLHPPISNSAEPTDEDKQRSKTIWRDSHCRLLSACRLVDLKGIDQTLYALPEILKVIPDARYIVAGEGSQDDRYRKIVADLNLQDNVDFIGWVGGGFKTALMRDADIFVQPGREIGFEREGYGMSYIEAALEGLPSISGDAGGAPEAIVNGKTGLIVDAGTSHPINSAVLSMLENKSDHDAMCDAARIHGEGQLWENRIADVLKAAGLAPIL